MDEKEKNSEEEQEEEVMGSIKDLKSEIEQIRRPSGSKKNPARTCKDLLLCNRAQKNGFYWIDPNHGCTEDAIRVYCNFTAGGETCIHPDTKHKMAPRKKWVRVEGAEWFSEYEGGYEVSYKSIGKTQLNFLRLLSEKAVQNFTFTCNGPVAWYDKKADNYDRAIRLQGADDTEYGYKKNRYDLKVLHDGCKNQQDGKSVFEVVTEDLNQMPIVDFAPGEMKPTDEFGFEVGPICFS